MAISFGVARRRRAGAGIVSGGARSIGRPTVSARRQASLAARKLESILTPSASSIWVKKARPAAAAAMSKISAAAALRPPARRRRVASMRDASLAT